MNNYPTEKATSNNEDRNRNKLLQNSFFQHVKKEYETYEKALKGAEGVAYKGQATIKNNGCRYIKKQIKNSNFSRYTKDIELLNLEDNYILKQFRDIRAKLQRMIPLRI